MKIYHVIQIKCARDHQPTDKAYISDITVTDISKSFTHKMAANTSWHRYRTTLRHCHLTYTAGNESAPIQLAQCRFPGLAISNAKILIHFYHFCYASAVLAMGLCLSVSVCVCVCLSQVGVLLKRLNVGSHKQHHTIVQGL